MVWILCKDLYRDVERVEGIEPSSLAWKARVIAFIRYPRLFT
jgi:hypothetical protein